MKAMALAVLFLVSTIGNAGGMSLMTQGQLIKKTKTHIIFETTTLRYKIRMPKKGARNQPFELKRISGKLYTLNADVSLIESKSYVKR